MKNYRAEVTIRYRNGAQIQDDVTIQASSFELAVRRAVSNAMYQGNRGAVGCTVKLDEVR
jgi:hypothetical protein